MLYIMILVLVVLIASILQTSTGYGFSIIGTPFLLLLYPAHTAIQINIILSICLSAVMIFKIRKEVDRDLFIKLIKGSIIGLILGIIIYLFADIRLLKISVGILILILTILLLSSFTLKRTIKRDFFTGTISGLLITSIGVPGPPLLLYFSGARIDQTTLRSTTLAYYLFVYTGSLVMQISFGGTNAETWLASLIAIPPLFAGVWFGQLFFKWISSKTFQKVTYIILIFTGTYLIVASIQL